MAFGRVYFPPKPQINSLPRNTEKGSHISDRNVLSHAKLTKLNAKAA
jgi:hypothetical protein